MDALWQEVSSGEQVARALGLADIGMSDLERLLLAPDSAAYLRVEVDEEPSARETFDLRVPGTRLYFNVTACKSLKGDVAVALAAYLTTHSVPVAAFAAALRKLNENLKVLAPEEIAMVRAIVRACPGNPYEVPVAEEAVREWFRGEADAVDDLLDALQAKGVVEGHRRGRVKLVY